MTYGILTNQTCLTLFEKINRRPYCNECQKKRSKFLEKDKKHNSCYSNLLLGFSSEDIDIPIDVLIVAEAHGGGREENFRPLKLFFSYKHEKKSC